MSKTARDVIEEHLRSKEIGGGEEARPWTAGVFVDAGELIAALDAAGFTIVPTEQYESIIEELGHLFQEAKDEGWPSIESAVGSKFNRKVDALIEAMTAADSSPPEEQGK